MSADGVVRFDKPWGYELHYALTDRYCGKVLVVRAGEELSLQYHERKHEAQYIESGLIKYTLGTSDRPGEHTEVTAGAGSVVILPPGAVHRLEALEDSRVFEVSTPDLEDLVRIEDDYGREGTNNP